MCARSASTRSATSRGDTSRSPSSTAAAAATEGTDERRGSDTRVSGVDASRAIHSSASASPPSGSALSAM